MAWLRTAISLMVVGLAVIRLVEPAHLGAALAGVLLVSVGAAGVAFGTRRFRSAAASIRRGEFARAESGVVVMTVSVVLVVTLLLALVLLLVV